MSVKNHLKEIRLKQGLSAQTLAELVGVKILQIQRLEKGERKLTLEWAIKLAKPLNCSAADILGYDNLGIESSKTISLPSTKVNVYENFISDKTIQILYFPTKILEFLNISGHNINIVKEGKYITFRNNKKPIYRLEEYRVSTLESKAASLLPIKPSQKDTNKY